ncbi:MAG: hypothetical protein ACM3WV_02385 [Bacillota bacterium]
MKTAPEYSGAGQAFPVRPLLQAVFLSVCGAAFLFLWDRAWLGTGAFGLAAFILFCGFFWRPMYHGIDKLADLAVRAASAILSWVFLAPFFLLIFIPGRLAMRITGKDPLQREFPSSARTFWIDRRFPEDPSLYRRQY